MGCATPPPNAARKKCVSQGDACGNGREPAAPWPSYGEAAEKAQKDSEEEGKVKAGIAQLHKEMEEAKSRTLGEYPAGLDPEDPRIRGRWTARLRKRDG